MWCNTVLLQAQQGILGNIMHLTLKKDGRCMEKIQPYILTPWEMWSDVNAREFSLFKEQRSEMQALFWNRNDSKQCYIWKLSSVI